MDRQEAPPRAAGHTGWAWRALGMMGIAVVAACHGGADAFAAAPPRGGISPAARDLDEQLLRGRSGATEAGGPERDRLRPVARWTFDDATQTPDVEGHHDMATIPHPSARLRVPDAVSRTQGTCQTSSAIAVPSHRFAVTGFVSLNLGTGPFTLFQKRSPGGQTFSIEVTPDGGDLQIDLRNSDGRSAQFEIDDDGPMAFYAFVVDVDEPYVLRYSPSAGAATVNWATHITDEPPSWGPPGTVHLGCTVPAIGDVVVYDDIAIWDRTITGSELLAMATRRQPALHSPSPTAMLRGAAPPEAEHERAPVVARRR
jgi:hypothetical protein